MSFVSNGFRVAIVVFAVSLGCQAQVLLEDFSTVRQSSGGDQLWAPYYGEDSGQSYAFENGMLKMVGAPQSGSCYTGCGIYFHMFDYPYGFPSGFAQYYIKSGSWDSQINRLRFKMKCSSSIPRRADGGDIIQVGTYVKQHGDNNASFQGQHYYHLFDPNVYANRWMVLELNGTPQHRVGESGSLQLPNDPEWVQPTTGAPVHYMDGLTRFYFDSQGSGWSNAACYFDDFTFDRKSGEAEFYVASVTGTHNGSAYEVSWAAPKEQDILFEVRYSTSSMKSAGFTSGTDGGTVRSTGTTYAGIIWKSPNMAESTTGLYVAIRPSGQAAFTEMYIPAMNVAGTTPVANKCDVNGDGTVNSADITAERNAAIGAAVCSADLDGNGRCDVVDVQRVVNASLGGTCRVGL